MKITYKVRSVTFLALALALVAGPLLGAPTAHAQTTTTKYLNGKIVFDSDRDGNQEVYTMNADGSNQVNISNNPVTDNSASWSPDGTKIVFQTFRGGNAEIYTMNADGSNQVNISNNPANDTQPVWSPDGTKLVFNSDRNGTQDIYTMNPDGSNVTRLTTGTGFERQPTWSPDSTKIAFDGNSSGNDEIYTMNADGTNQTRLTNDSYIEYSVSWSPDGTRIAFSGDRDNSPSPYNTDIHTMKTDGSDVVRVTNTVAEEDSGSYSPDGTKFLSTVYPDENFNSSEVFSMNIDGSGRTQLSSGGGYDEAYDPGAWQPLPYTVTTNDNGTTTSTIAASDNYPTTDYTVATNETLNLDGTLCNVTVQSGATLAGTGHACTITVDSGGTIAPGHSPGCITSGNLSLSGTYTAQLAGTTPCSGYDQLQVTGAVVVGGALNASLLNGFVPKAGDSFTLIANDGTDPVTGTFAGLPEGATLTVNGSVFKISYTGGDGNDVTLTAQSVPGVPNTGVMAMKTNTWPILFVAILSSAILLITIRRRQRAGK